MLRAMRKTKQREVYIWRKGKWKSLLEVRLTLEYTGKFLFL